MDYFDPAGGGLLIGVVAIPVLAVVGGNLVFLDVASVSAAFGGVAKSANTRGFGDVAWIVIGDSGAVCSHRADTGGSIHGVVGGSKKVGGSRPPCPAQLAEQSAHGRKTRR